jgi:hypothetical protein
MKLPSIQQVIQSASRTLIRFPLVLINAGLGTLATLILINHEGPARATILFNILFATLLGIPLLLGLALVAEKRKWGKALSFCVQGIGVILLVIYAFSIPSYIVQAPAIHLLRLLILAVALHLFVAVAPFIASSELNGFWHYNKSYLFRLLPAILYSMVLFAGFSVALAALDNLFGMDIPGKRYAELWVIVVGLFNTWFFLSGVPEDLDSLEQSIDYPKSLKIFTQYILSPLILVYFIILYAYIAKILIAWDWPQGWVSKLILGFSATGLLSLLLLHPIREHAENTWIKKAWRWFFIILIPLVIMLPLAVWRRVSQYGITEGRYLALVLAAWLALMVIYFIFSRKNNIKVIPGSLCLLALLVCYGSWSVFSVSEKSQIGRLQALLTKNFKLADGRIQKTPSEVSNEDSRQISSIISYLHDFHGYDRIQSWFQQKLKQDSIETKSAYIDPALVAEMMGIEYMRGWMGNSEKTILLDANPESVTHIEGYKHMVRAQHINENRTNIDFPEQEISSRFNTKLDRMTFIVNQQGKTSDSLQIDLQPLIDRLVKDYGDTNPNNIPPEKMSACGVSSRIKLKVYLRHIQLQRKGTAILPERFNIEILYTIAEKP